MTSRLGSTNIAARERALTRCGERELRTTAVEVLRARVFVDGRPKA